MKLRKADKMEQSHSLKAGRNAFMFYTVALFVWGSMISSLRVITVGNL